MQDIIALAKIISKQKIKDLQVFKDGSKQHDLYQGVITGNIKSEGDLIQNLYNGKVNKKSVQMLQYRLKQKLLNALFHIDLNKARYSNYSRSRINVLKEWSFVNILLVNNARTVAIEICEEAFRKANKFGFTDLQILLGRLLMRHFGYLDINKRKHKYYQTVIFEKLEILKQELITEKYYTEISQDYVLNKSADNKKMHQKLESYCEELGEYERQNKTYAICLFYYKILIAKYLFEQDHTRAKEVGEKGLQYFSQKEIRTPIAEFLFRQTVHICHIQLNEYDEAIKLIRKNIKIATPYKFSWFKEWGYYFGWALITKNYDEMYNCTSIATNNRHIKNYPRQFEIWSIKEAYVDLFVSLRKIKNSTLEKSKLKKFRLNRFLNEVPKYSQDKRGLNVSILIAHFLHLLKNNKYDQLLNKIENLKQYSYRYLRQGSTFRSNCFIKMISKIPDTHYHPKALVRHTDKLYNKLINTTYMYSDNPSEIEVIPYETLWELIIEILSKTQNKNLAQPW